MTINLLNFLLYYFSQSSRFLLIYQYKSSYIQILDIFWNFGLIYGYKVIFCKTHKYIIIYPKKTKTNLKLCKKLIFFSLPSKREYISIASLSKLIKNENGFSIFLISTSVGIFDGITAVNKNISGELICKISI